MFKEIKEMKINISNLQLENRILKDRIEKIDTERLLKHLRRKFKTNITIEYEFYDRRLAINGERAIPIYDDTCKYLESKNCERDIESFLYKKSKENNNS